MLPRLALDDDVEVFKNVNDEYGLRARCYIPSGTEVAYFSRNNETRFIASACGCAKHPTANLVTERQPNGLILLRAARDIMPCDELQCAISCRYSLMTPMRRCIGCMEMLPETDEHFRAARPLASDAAKLRTRCKRCEREQRNEAKERANQRKKRSRK
jgi:hypothetical protein